MESWSDTFEQHPVHDALEAVVESANQRATTIDPTDDGGPSLAADDRACLLSIAAWSALGLSILSAIDPSTVWEDDLIDLAEAADALRAAVESADNPAEDGTVDVGMAALKESIHNLPPTAPSPGGRDPATPLVQRLAGVSAEIEKALGEAKAEIRSLHEAAESSSRQNAENIALIKSEITSVRDQITELRSQFEAEARATQREIRDEATTTESARAEAAQVALDNFEGRFSVIADGFDSAIDDMTSKAEVMLATLERNRDEASELVALIGRTGMAGHYSQDAEAESKRDVLWRTIALIVGAVAVFLAYNAVEASTSAATGAAEVVAKSVVSLAAFGLATYAGRLASDHRRTARRSRNMELALRSIGPYLEEFDDETRLQKMHELTEVFFNSQNLDHLGSHDGSVGGLAALRPRRSAD